MEKKFKTKTLTSDQRIMCRRRGLNPDNYRAVKDTYGTLYLLDLRYGKIKVIQKWN